MMKSGTVGAVLLAVLIAASGAVAKPAKKVAKPSIKITGISVDAYNAEPGTKITYVPNRPVNACYDIGGADQTPVQVDVVFFLHETGIPKNAPTTVDIVTPWDEQSEPDSTDKKVPAFNGVWFTDKGHGLAALYGGSDAAGNDYHYDDEGTRGDEFNGNYSVLTTVKVAGKTLRARGTLSIDCDG
jgi:hypothetical protein